MSVTDGELTPFAEGVWVDSAPVRILGMPLTATMTVLQLSEGSLLIHSPITLTPACRAAIEALGPVAPLYTPNLYCHRTARKPGDEEQPSKWSPPAGESVYGLSTCIAPSFQTSSGN